MHLTAAFAVLALGSCTALAQNFDAGLKAYESKDYKTAMDDFRPLAEKGNARAAFIVGLLYYDGKGVPQDYLEASKWFEQAADRAYARAQYNLGEMYATGQGVKRDYMIAYKWLSLCAASGTENCADHRDWVAKKLKGSQLAAAQRMAREWKPVEEGKPDEKPLKPE